MLKPYLCVCIKYVHICTYKLAASIRTRQQERKALLHAKIQLYNHPHSLTVYLDTYIDQ